MSKPLEKQRCKRRMAGIRKIKSCGVNIIEDIDETYVSLQTKFTYKCKTCHNLISVSGFTLAKGHSGNCRDCSRPKTNFRKAEELKTPLWFVRTWNRIRYSGWDPLSPHYHGLPTEPLWAHEAWEQLSRKRNAPKLRAKKIQLLLPHKGYMITNMSWVE